MNNTSLLKAVLLFSGFASFHAAAHFPLMSCHLAQDKVICEAGYSDGSTAVDYDVEMYDYDDNLIAKEKKQISVPSQNLLTLKQISIWYLMPDMKARWKWISLS